MAKKNPTNPILRALREAAQDESKAVELLRQHLRIGEASLKGSTRCSSLVSGELPRCPQGHSRNGPAEAGPFYFCFRTLGAAIEECVAPGSTIHTDENSAYKHLGRSSKYSHESVNHFAGEYVRGDVTTNGVEGFFSIFKRGLYGTFHSVSKHHLPRYIGEFEFRYNTRELNDGERTMAAIRGSEGKRLLYAEPS